MASARGTPSWRDIALGGFLAAAVVCACGSRDAARDVDLASSPPFQGARAAEPRPAPVEDVPASCKNPPCPLFDWMAARAEPALVRADFAALSALLEEVGAGAPPGYANWASIAADGANAARAAEIDAVRAACRACHEQYADRYARELRSGPIVHGG